MSSFDNLSYVNIIWFICNWRDMSLAGLMLFKLYPTRKEKNWQRKNTIDMTLLSWSWLGRSIWTNTDLSASQKKEKSLLEMRELLLVRTNLTGQLSIRPISSTLETFKLVKNYYVQKHSWKTVSNTSISKRVHKKLGITQSNFTQFGNLFEKSVVESLNLSKILPGYDQNKI